MSFLTHIDIERIKVKYYDPANPMSRLVFKDPKVCIWFDFAIVDNNADPDKRGRLKVRFPHWGDIITNWIPLVRPYASNEAGIWMLPDVGTQVIVCFFDDCASRPIVIGSVYTPRAYPPIEDNEENNIKVLTTRSGSKIILDDTDGEEKILIHTKDGAMRLVQDKEKGLSIVNENGDITIKCRKLTIESADDAFITINKDLSITADQTISKKTNSNFSIKSGKDVIFKAKSKINIKGNTGVTAGVQQMAKEDDQVVGVDMHDIQVPSNTGLVTVPMVPHPYLGKLADKLSQDVMINDKPAATKGSKSKFDTPGHICMPPGVKFKSNPNNEGEVSSGTVANVKINDKEAAVLGSMVKTCNDPQPQETCTIVAVGAPVVLPILMPGMDPDQFKKNGGTRFNTATPITTMAKTAQSRKQPKLQNPEWSLSQIKAGEEVTLSVSLVDQYEMANVTFTIWEDGADMEKDMPVAVLKDQNKGGKAEVAARLYKPGKQDDEDEKKYFFTVRSFRCEELQSGNLTVEKIIPEFSDLTWSSIKDEEEDSTEEEIEKIEYGKNCTLRATVKNIDEGDKVHLKIYKKGNEKDDNFLMKEILEIKENKVEFEWQALFSNEQLTELTNKDEMKYIFILSAYSTESSPSPELEVTFGVDIDILMNPEHVDIDNEFILKSEDDSYKEIRNIKDDRILGDDKITLRFDNLKPGLYYSLQYVNKSENDGLYIFYKIPFRDLITT